MTRKVKVKVESQEVGIYIFMFVFISHTHAVHKTRTHSHTSLSLFLSIGNTHKPIQKTLLIIFFWHNQMSKKKMLFSDYNNNAFRKMPSSPRCSVPSVSVGQIQQPLGKQQQQQQLGISSRFLGECDDNRNLKYCCQSEILSSCHQLYVFRQEFGSCKAFEQLFLPYL